MAYTKVSQLAQAFLLYKNYTSKSYNNKLNNKKTVDELISSTGFRETIDTLFPALFSFHGLDVVEVINNSNKLNPTEKAIVKKALYHAIDEVGTKKYEVFTKDKLDLFNHYIDTIIEDVTTAHTSINTSGTNTTKIKNKLKNNIQKNVKNLKVLFRRPYLLSYQDRATAEKNYGTSAEPSVKVLASTFKTFRDNINSTIKAKLTEVVNKALEDQQIGTDSVLIKDPNYVTSIVFNWGHTRTDSGLISSKLLMSLVQLKNIPESTDSALRAVVSDFEQTTGQIKTKIKVSQGTLTRGDPEILSLVIESNYFQKVLIQDATYNQEILGKAEYAWNFIDFLNKNTEEAIAFKNALGIKNVDDFMRRLIPMRASPSILDKIEKKLISALKGKDISFSKKVINLQNLNIDIKRKVRKVTLKGKDNTLGKVSRRNNPPVIESRLTNNLVTLQRLLDAHLHEKIRRNMGTGNRKDVLNYRSGRFAESVKVERLSESRQGMITAFYSYMKNPYATFSTGGRQELPRTRDPKTLIARSIREVAQTLVTNRLRAVNV